MKEECEHFVVQFDGKDTKEAVLVTGLAKDNTTQTMPLQIINFKCHPTGKYQHIFN